MTKQTETQNAKRESHTAQRFVSIIFGVIEAVLAFRLVFKLLGANPINGFVKGLYWLSHFLVGIFEGIFPQATSSGVAATAVFEPATLIAIVVVALIAWAVLKLMTPRSGTRVVWTEKTEQAKQEKPAVEKGGQ